MLQPSWHVTVVVNERTVVYFIHTSFGTHGVNDPQIRPCQGKTMCALKMSVTDCNCNIKKCNTCALMLLYHSIITPYWVGKCGGDCVRHYTGSPWAWRGTAWHLTSCMGWTGGCTYCIYRHVETVQHASMDRMDEKQWWWCHSEFQIIMWGNKLLFIALALQ